MPTSRTQVRRFAAATAAAVAAVVLSSCAATPPAGSLTLERRIEAAATPQDHEAIALEYERQAALDGTLAKRHVGFAQIYRRNTSARGGAEAHEPLARHCDELSRLYRKAADENAAAARLHRELARETSRP